MSGKNVPSERGITIIRYPARKGRTPYAGALAGHSLILAPAKGGIPGPPCGGPGSQPIKDWVGWLADRLFLVACCLAMAGIFHSSWLSRLSHAEAIKEAPTEEGRTARNQYGGKAAPSKDEKVTFYFVDVELPTIAKFISEITGRNFIFDERVRGKITIIAPSKLSVGEAYNLFTSILELKGFAIVPTGVDAYKIVPAAEAKQQGIQVASARVPVNENYIARLISLQHLSAEEALRFLQPVISRDGYISAFGPGNLLLVIDTVLNIEKVLAIIQSIDQASLKEEPEIVYLKYANPDVVAKTLNEGFSRGRGRGMPGAPPIMAAMGRAVADPRLNALVIFGDRETRESMRSLIALMDAPSPEAHERINVYFLENADATELAKVLEGLLKGMQSARQAAPGMQGAPTVPFEAAGGISITPDKATNSLVIVSSPVDYQSLVPVIKQLDRRRKQVFVEAILAEISQDKLFELGTKWRAMATKDGEILIAGGAGTIDSATISSIISGLAGLALGGLGNYLTIPKGLIPGATSDLTIPGLVALFSLSEFQGLVNILSTPQILTSDNQEAEIVVGENVPFITGKQTNPQLATSVFSTIERQDVGIKLRITPQIAEGDYVKLDIYQEISAVKEEPTLVTVSVGPTTTKRSTKTSVVVKNGQTVVISGLIQERTEEKVTKVPWLGDIPIIGWLFKYKNVSKKKTNLFLFISPRMVREAEGTAKSPQDSPRGRPKEEAAPKEPPRQEQPQTEQPQTEQPQKGELLVRFREGITEEEAQGLIAKRGASLTKYMETIGVYALKPKEGQSVEEAAKEFAGMAEVEFAEPDLQDPMRWEK